MRWSRGGATATHVHLWLEVRNAKRVVPSWREGGVSRRLGGQGRGRVRWRLGGWGGVSGRAGDRRVRCLLKREKGETVGYQMRDVGEFKKWADGWRREVGGGNGTKEGD